MSAGERHLLDAMSQPESLKPRRRSAWPSAPGAIARWAQVVDAPPVYPHEHCPNHPRESGRRSDGILDLPCSCVPARADRASVGMDHVHLPSETGRGARTLPDYALTAVDRLTTNATRAGSPARLARPHHGHENVTSRT